MSITLKFIYTAIMLFAVFIVVGGKFPAFGRTFIAQEREGYVVGDLYRMCDLDRFREEIPLIKPSVATPLEEAEILTLGDSFFNTALGSDLFANELAKKSGLRVHDLHTTAFPEPQSHPLAYLEKIGYQPGKSRIMILESVERRVLERGDSYNVESLSSGNELGAFAYKILKNSDLVYFFKNNVIVRPLGKWLKNFRFQYLNIVDKSIGEYSLNPAMLFYQPDLEFARQKKTEAMLDSTADSIARLSETLKRRYNIDLIYLAIPNKYSVYHGLTAAESRYDDFLPRLSEKLTERGVKNIDVYTLYSRYNKTGMPLLYFSSDTHYTPHGKLLLADACVDLISRVRSADSPRSVALDIAAGSGSRQR